MAGRGGCCGEPCTSPSRSRSFAHSPSSSLPLPPYGAPPRRFFSFARSPPRSVILSPLRISLRLEPRRTSHPAPREPIPTHVEAPTRDAADHSRTRPNVPDRRRHPCAQPPPPPPLLPSCSRAIVYNDRDPPPARCRP